MKSTFVASTGISGIVAGLAAFVVSAFYPEKRPFIAFLTAVSLAALLFFFAVHFETLRSFSRKRSAQLGMNSVLMVLLFVFIVIVLNLMIRQYYFRFDLSSTANYSLAPQTRNVVGSLDSLVRITAFGREGDPSFARLHDLLEGYRYLNGNIVYTLVDLDRNPQLAREMGVSQYNTVVVERSGTRIASPGIDQQTITNAIISATRSAKKGIFFTAGHGERSIDSEGRTGMSIAAARLRAIGYTVASLPLSGVDAVPQGCDVLVLAGPREALPSPDGAKIDAFLRRGGKVLLLLDPGYDTTPLTGRAGIGTLKGTIADPTANLGGADEHLPLVTSYPETPVTRDFGLSTVFPGAIPLRLEESNKVFERFTIAAASAGSRLVAGGMTIDMRGAYVIAAAAGSRSGKDIMIVIGSADFASNAFINNVGNSNFFLNCVNWLAGEAALVSLAPRKSDFVPVYLTRSQSNAILYVSVFVIPAVMVMTGAVIWWKRKRL